MVPASLPATLPEWDTFIRSYTEEFTRRARAVLGTATRTKVDPEDVVQETFLLAFARRHQFRGTSRPEFDAWLRRILASRLSDTIRRYHATAARAGEMPGGDHDPLDPGTSPSRRAARREGADRVAAALCLLPEDYRRVLVWREYDGLPFATIAAQLGRTENAVRKLWPRALLALRANLSHHPGHDPFPD